MTYAERMSALEAEQSAFEGRLDALMVEHAGEFALFKGGQPVAFFGTYDEAFKTALQRFGTDDVFFISEVKRHGAASVSLAWDLGVMFAE